MEELKRTVREDIYIDRPLPFDPYMIPIDYDSGLLTEEPAPPPRDADAPPVVPPLAST